MQEIQVVLHDNKSFNIQLETYDTVALTQILNSPNLTVINIGSIILNRNAIKMIYPVSSVVAE